MEAAPTDVILRRWDIKCTDLHRQPVPKLQRYRCRVTCSPEAVDDTLGHGQTLICHTAPAWPPPCSPVTSPILLSVGVFLTPQNRTNRKSDTRQTSGFSRNPRVS